MAHHLDQYVVISNVVMSNFHCRCTSLLIPLFIPFQMGYGSRALSLLRKYYEFKMPSLDEEMLPSEEIQTIEEDEVNLLEERIGKYLVTSLV